MAEYCSACGETLTPNATVCTFCGQAAAPARPVVTPERPAALASSPPPSALIVPTPPVIVVPTPPAPTLARSTRNPNNALYLEFLGMIGFLGIGQIYAGRVPLGIVMLGLWLVFFGGLVGSTLSLAYLCLFVPALLVCYFSGRSARNYLRRQQGYQPPPTHEATPR